MYCSKCGRLSEDRENVCKFCGNVFDESQPSPEIQPNYQIAYETNEPENVPSPKYIKKGWLVVVGAVAAVAVVVALIISLATQSYKDVVKDYLENYFEGDFYGVVDCSAADMGKVFEHQSTGNKLGDDILGGVYDFGSMFGLDDMFGFSRTYSTYEEMMTAFEELFKETTRNNKAMYGENSKIKIVRNAVLNDDEVDTVLSYYTNSNGNVLRSGEVEEVRKVQVAVKFKNPDKDEVSASLLMFTVKIDGEYYVITDTTFNPQAVAQQ